MNYKKYRLFLYSAYGNYFVATSETVNNLVDLAKQWLTMTNAGMYMPPETSGSVTLQQVDPRLGSYKAEKTVVFAKKSKILNAVRQLGGR